MTPIPPVSTIGPPSIQVLFRKLGLLPTLMPNRNYYEILGVPVGASEAEIRRGYRQKVMEFHPDRSYRADANDRMVEINKAYEVLGDPTLRASYDRTIFGNNTYSHTETSSWHHQEQERRERQREERERQESERRERERQERLEREWRGRNFYEILGVPIDASEEEISDAYFQKYLAYYKGSNMSPDDEASFQELNEAYQVLTNSDLKALYDNIFVAYGRYSHAETPESGRDEQGRYERSWRERDQQEWERWQREEQGEEEEESSWGPIGRFLATALVILLLHGACFALRAAAN